MNNLKGYEIYESWFSKTFNDMIDDVDELFIKYAVYDGQKKSDSIEKSVDCNYEISEILLNILKKFGRKMTEEQMKSFVKRFSTMHTFGSGYKFKFKSSYDTLEKIKENYNSIYNILKHLRDFYGMKIDIDEREFDNPVVIYIKNGFSYLSHKSYVDRIEKENREKHKGVDPYGEEQWDVDEGIKWYSKGKFTEEEDFEESYDTLEDNIIRVGDRVEINGIYDAKSFNNTGEVVRIFNTFPRHDEKYILQEDNGRDIDVVIKIEDRKDGTKSQFSQYNDCFKFTSISRDESAKGRWDGTYVYNKYLKIKKI